MCYDLHKSLKSAVSYETTADLYAVGFKVQQPVVAGSYMIGSVVQIHLLGCICPFLPS